MYPSTDHFRRRQSHPIRGSCCPHISVAAEEESCLNMLLTVGGTDVTTGDASAERMIILLAAIMYGRAGVSRWNRPHQFGSIYPLAGLFEPYPNTPTAWWSITDSAKHFKSELPQTLCMPLNGLSGFPTLFRSFFPHGVCHPCRACISPIIVAG